MHWIDDFLIDRVFQPVANRLAGWMSCYGISAFLLTGYLIIMTLLLLYIRNWFALLFHCSWIRIVWRAHALDKDPPANAIPEVRIDIGYQFCRMVVTMAIAVSIPVSTGRTMLFGAGWYTFVPIIVMLPFTGLYFMACRANPPARRRAPLPIGTVHDAI